MMHTNALINETSPYLLQHAHNPVDWYAWAEEALEKARNENKMLLISVGYAACHWCHVMEHESYEDPAVAEIMNKHFVCIKVDREERPDVDQVYMNAAYLTNGNGGWPLNALAMPDGKPFFAGTYFPKEKWIQLLEYFIGLYAYERTKLEDQANAVAKGINDIENIPFNNNEVSTDKQTLEELFTNLDKRIDKNKGGTSGNIKFPMPSIWAYLLDYYYFSKNTQALDAVNITLSYMAKGGIYDQVGGGFCRYATDSDWHAPHFEKMLYDNAQLVSLYSKAFQVTGNPLYKKIVYETISFVKRELTSAEGGFYSSLDADSEGEEGKFYVWNLEEVNDILGNDAPLFADYFGITSSGNWEYKKNIPDAIMGNKELTKKSGLSENELFKKMDDLKLKMLSARENRVRPNTDDKVLTSWNALMTQGLLDAYKAFEENEFLQMAQRNIHFLLDHVYSKDNSLFRNYKNGRATIPAFLDDYAFMISALIAYYQVSFDEQYLQKANSLTRYVNDHFFDEASGMFFYTDDQHSNLIARKMEVSDNVTPSSNSEMAKNLWLLSHYFDDLKYQSQSIQLVKNVIDDIKKNMNYYSNWASVLALQIQPAYEVAIVGKNCQERLSEFHQHYLPGVVLSGGKEEGKLALLKDKLVKGKTMIYVCVNKTCGLPVEVVSDAMKQIKK